MTADMKCDTGCDVYEYAGCIDPAAATLEVSFIQYIGFPMSTRE